MIITGQEKDKPHRILLKEASADSPIYNMGYVIFGRSSNLPSIGPYFLNPPSESENSPSAPDSETASGGSTEGYSE